jgi:hypothetical protein
VALDTARWRHGVDLPNGGRLGQRHPGLGNCDCAKKDAWHVVMPAIGCFAIVMLVNRNPAIILVMMVFINAYLRRAMRRVVNRPRRN